MGSHTGDFFERFIKKAVIRIANLGADLRDGERGIGEKLAGPFNAGYAADIPRRQSRWPF